MKSIVRLIAIYVLAVGSAYAQAGNNVTLYGVIDTGIEYVSHANAAGNGVVRQAAGNTAGSRWGLRGTEDLGGGTSAIFLLESGFNSDAGTSAQGGRLFGRQALVGLDNASWGKLTLGRQNNLLFDSIPYFDAIRFTTYSILSQDLQFTNRADNSVKYTKVLGGLTASALYSAGYDSTIQNGSEVPGSPRTGQEISGSLSYASGNLGAALVFDQKRGTSPDKAGQLERRYVGALSYSFGPGSVMGGYRYLQSTLTNSPYVANLYWVGASYAPTANTDIRLAMYWNDKRHSPDDSISYALSAVYNFSKRTLLYLDVSFMDNRGKATTGVVLATSAPAGVSQTGAVVGIRHAF